MKLIVIKDVFVIDCFYLNLWLNEWNDWIIGKNFNMGYVDMDLFNGKC